MKRAVATALVAIMLVTAGCNGIPDSGNSTDRGTPGTVQETTAPGTTTSSPPQTPTPTRQEQKYLKSGKEFTRVMGIRLNRTHGMYIWDRGFYRNNTVSMSYRLDEETPLYESMMDVAQTVSVIIPARTTTNEDVAMQDGRQGKIYRPEMVYIRIVDYDGNRIGTFEIDPDIASKYRSYEFDGDVFAQDVVETLDLEHDVERGERPLGWYLNRSQLYDWTQTYAKFLRDQTDPSETSFEEEFPLEGLNIDPGEMRVQYNLTWDSEEMGQDILSGHAAVNDAYYLTVKQAWSKPPHRLSFYFDRPDGADVEGHMDLDAVLWLLNKKNPMEYKNEYFQKAETEVVEDG